MGVFRKRFFYPLIQTHSGCLSSRDDLGMQIRRNPDVESPGEALIGIHPAFFTGLQVNLERRPAFPQQTFYISSIKVCASGKTQEFPTEHANVGIESNNSFMLVDLHYILHRFTPFCSNHLRILATAPLSVSGLGWGLWYTRTCPNKKTSTREPSRSLISAPSSRNSETISAQRMLPGTGCAKINSKVRLCFNFTNVMVPKYSTSVKSDNS